MYIRISFNKDLATGTDIKEAIRELSFVIVFWLSSQDSMS